MTTLPEWAKWLARDEDGALYAFENKPLLYEKGTWVPQLIDGTMEYLHIEETDDTFKHIEWTDEEPTEIKRGIGLGLPSLNKYDITIFDYYGHDSERYKKHRNLVDELHEIYVAKNKDYGNSFGESIDEFGIIAGVVRIGDKYNRLKTLAKGHEPLVNDESMVDTLKDMANYCLLTIIELEAD